MTVVVEFARRSFWGLKQQRRTLYSFWSSGVLRYMWDVLMLTTWCILFHRVQTLVVHIPGFG